MAESEPFVDVTYRGLEVGRLKLSEVGPRTAYLEHSAPLPVGTVISLLTEEGHALSARVIRVHEQVAGVERPAGMRVRASGLDRAARRWWEEHRSAEDPEIPSLGATEDEAQAEGQTAAGEARTGEGSPTDEDVGKNGERGRRAAPIGSDGLSGSASVSGDEGQKPESDTDGRDGKRKRGRRGKKKKRT